MANNEENVMDLLDSLDVKQGQKAKPKKSSSKRKENNAKKAAGEDILQFLDELDPKKESKEEKPAQTEAPQASASQADESGAAANEGETQTETRQPSNDNIPDVADPMATISSWWNRNKGGIWSKAQETIQDTVSDAVKQARQAEALVREEQRNFSLNSLSTRLTSVLHTIVPPISRHEQLRIHIFHDMVGYPGVDKLLYEVFDYVMDQVEGGGDLNLVVQKGKERHRVGSDFDVHRKLNYVRCTLAEGVKLARANTEDIRENREGAADEEKAQDPNIRISEVFVSIQPVVAPKEVSGSIESSDESLYFVIYLADADHNIELSTASQALPYEWARWLDNDDKGIEDAAIDPRDWVFGWVEDALNLAFGVVAQKYVTVRMGLATTGEEGKSQGQS